MRETKRRKEIGRPICQTAFFAIIGLCLLLQANILAATPFTHRIVWGTVGMTSKGIDTCVGRMKAAASLGYNGFIVTDPTFNHLENPPANYFNNAKRAVAEAQKCGIALIPHHFYQADAAYDNYNLSEAFPVRGTRYKVSGSEARVMPDPLTFFKNSGFESGTTSWQLNNMSGAVVEKTGAKAGNACLRISGGGKYARIRQVVQVKPHRAYKLSAWIKTKGFANWEDAKFSASGGGQPLLGKRYRPFGTPVNDIHKGVWTALSSNMNWTLCQTDFNSLYATSATIEFVVSDPVRSQVGTIWLDDVKIEEVGLYETVRSQTRPVTVTSVDGKTIYIEGTDYIVDPLCDKFTIESFNYQGDLTIPTGSAIKNGQELAVSWYQMSDVEQVEPEANFCLSETREALRDNITRIDQVMGHDDRIFFGFDEWRTAFWDDRCELYPKAKTAGEYLSGALKMSHDLVWSTNNCREVIVVGDMFDPYFNAWKPYAMTNGGCLNSWKNLDTNLIILNWRPGPHWDNMSLRFFMGIDDSLNPEGKVWRQILNVLDGNRVISWLNMVEKAEKEGGRGVIGVNYVDWYANYSQMATIKNACVSRGRWGANPLPKQGRCVSIKNRGSHAGPAALNARMSLKWKDSRNTEVQYTVSQKGMVQLKVVDLHGRLVSTLVQKGQTAGARTAVWNTAALPAGIYFLHLSVNGSRQTARKHIIF